MKTCVFSTSLILLFMMSATQAQFKNPGNIDYTWKTDISKHNVALSEISLVLPKGSFPKIDYPQFLEMKQGLEAFFMHEPVISVEIGGKAKAYPLNMLTTHEISNDTLGATPILATYCPLCNSGVVFDRRILIGGKQEVLEFEVSGMLRKSDMVMLDTETESLWQQFMGESIVGTFTGTYLDVIPSLIISVEEFFTRYPGGLILSNESSNATENQSYGNNPYVGYDSEDGLPYDRFFSNRDVDSRLPSMERVIDIEVDGSYKIYPFSKIASLGIINDNFKGVQVVLFHSRQTVSATDAGQISQSRSIGSVTAFSPVVNDKVLTFKIKNGIFRDKQTKSSWDITGFCYDGEMKGSRLMILPHSNHFSFVWLAFHPDSEIYQ
jgi:hypothetical protein